MRRLYLGLGVSSVAVALVVALFLALGPLVAEESVQTEEYPVQTEEYPPPDRWVWPDEDCIIFHPFDSSWRPCDPNEPLLIPGDPDKIQV